MTHRLLLDVSSLMYRAFFALPASITGQDGRPVNALHGYLDWTANLIQSRRPGDVVHAYDQDWRPVPRVELYDGYKANRPPDPDGLPEQFPVLRDVLDAFGMRQAEVPGWEAEDAIGAICAGADGGDRIDIVTGDRDLIQLVRDPAVRVLFTVRGVSDMRELDEAGVLERFGVPASRYLDFAVLRGDPSDGLPGVRGVGEKTARALVDAYPSLEAMLEDAARPSPERRPIKGAPQLRAKIRAAVGELPIMRELSRIRTEALVETWQRDRDDVRLDNLARRHKLSGPIGRLREAMRT